jgi:hypothetical protein
MKEEQLICPTTPKLSTVTERCLKTKLQIYTAPRNGTYIVVGPSCITQSLGLRLLYPVIDIIVPVIIVHAHSVRLVTVKLDDRSICISL